MPAPSRRCLAHHDCLPCVLVLSWQRRQQGSAVAEWQWHVAVGRSSGHGST
jgi:hypothetical protein